MSSTTDHTIARYFYACGARLERERDTERERERDTERERERDTERERERDTQRERERKRYRERERERDTERESCFMWLAGESWNVAESGKLFARVLGMHLEQLYCVESTLWQIVQASYVSKGFRCAKLKSCQVGLTRIR